MNSSIQILLTCPCRPGFMYKSANSMKQHKLTKTHVAWETAQDEKNNRVLSKQLENEVERLKLSLQQRDRIEHELLNRIKDLEKQIQYYQFISGF